MNVGKNIKWVVSKTAPDKKEADYWIDITSNSNGGVIKYYNGNSWVLLEAKTENIKDSELHESITLLKQEVLKLNEQIKAQNKSYNDIIFNLKQRIKHLEQVNAQL